MSVANRGFSSVGLRFSMRHACLQPTTVCLNVLYNLYRQWIDSENPWVRQETVDYRPDKDPWAPLPIISLCRATSQPCAGQVEHSLKPLSRTKIKPASAEAESPILSSSQVQWIILFHFTDRSSEINWGLASPITSQQSYPSPAMC